MSEAIFLENYEMRELTLAEIDLVSGAWDVSGAAGATVAGAAGGAVAGAVVGAMAGGVGAGPGALTGAVGGAIGGLVTYTVSEAWGACFG
jgi:hypothetical protein